jgi:hypothetical protein
VYTSIISIWLLIWFFYYLLFYSLLIWFDWNALGINVNCTKRIKISMCSNKRIKKGWWVWKGAGEDEEWHVKSFLLHLEGFCNIHCRFQVVAVTFLLVPCRLVHDQEEWPQFSCLCLCYSFVYFLVESPKI